MRECPKCSTELAEDVEECEKCGEQVPGAPPDDQARLDIGRALTGICLGLSGAVRYYWPMLVAALLFIVMQWGFPFVEWWKSWTRQNSYSSHGPLVPLIALFVVWANRKRLAVAKIAPSWIGLLLIVPSIPLFIYGRWTGSGNICAMTFMAFLVGAVLMFTGSRMTRLLLFPMLYLLFMVPPPGLVLDRVTSPVQIWSTTIGAKVLSVTGRIVGESDEGWSVKQMGTKIMSPKLPSDVPGETEGTLRVEGECSGFRMLISLITFTAFFVYLVRASWWKKTILVAVSLPLSLLVNGLRIAAIGYVGIWTESATAMMKFHSSWAMVFELVLSFAILFGIARLMKANEFGIPDPVIDPADAARMDAAPRYRLVGRGLRGPAVIALFCVVILSNLAIRPLELSARGTLDKAGFPKHFARWTSQDLELDPITREELKTAAMLERVYYVVPDDPEAVHVSVMAAADTDAFHDPHSCLPGGGNSIDLDKIVTIRFDNPTPMTVRATCLQFSNELYPDGALLVYWYVTGAETYARTGDLRLAMRQAQAAYIKATVKSWIGLGDGRAVEQDYARNQTFCYRFDVRLNYEDTDTALARLESFIRQFVANSPHFE